MAMTAPIAVAASKGAPAPPWAGRHPPSVVARRGKIRGRRRRPIAAAAPHPLSVSSFPLLLLLLAPPVPLSSSLFFASSFSVPPPTSAATAKAAATARRQPRPVGPRPPPRFDSFADSIVGGWECGAPGGGASSRVQEVEEVMRSCGGAVQGVREVPLLLLENNDAAAAGDGGSSGKTPGPYHNRADDGFVYFDCGTYSSGPVRLELDGDGGGGGGAARVMGSLAFPSTLPKRRVLVSASIGRSEDGASTLEAKMAGLSRAPFRMPSSSSSSDGGGNEVGEGRGGANEEAAADCPLGPPVPIRWDGASVWCRMPTPGQPWMLQRVKWEGIDARGPEEKGEEEGDGADDGDGAAAGAPSPASVSAGEEEERKPGRDDLVGWAAVSSVGGEDGDDASLWGDNLAGLIESIILPGSGEKEEEDGKRGAAMVVQMGALCRATGQVRAVLRGYDGRGNLRCVATREGTAEFR